MKKHWKELNKQIDFMISNQHSYYQYIINIENVQYIIPYIKSYINIYNDYNEKGEKILKINVLVKGEESLASNTKTKDFYSVSCCSLKKTTSNL